MSEFKLTTLAMGRYALDHRDSGERIGWVKRDRTVKSFRIWDAYDAYGRWIRGFDTRGEAEQAVVIRYRRNDGPIREDAE